jgi:hypothetical protein
MRKLTHTQKVTIVKHLITGYQVGLTSMFVYGITRVVLGLVMGEFSNISFGLYY